VKKSQVGALDLTNDIKNRQLLEQNNFDKWYEALKSELTPSCVFMMTPLESRSLVQYYEHHHMGKAALASEQEQALEQLAVKIEHHGSQHLGDNVLQKGFFIRLTTRSPKDSRIFSNDMFQSVSDECDKYKAKGIVVDDNLKLNIIYVLFVKKMIVHSGKEAVQILGGSHRCWQDITSSIDVGSPVGVVLRQWANIHPSLEFRGFVYNKSLNAISSYNRAVCWPGVPEQVKSIEEKCRTYYDSVKHKIPANMNNFIVDFAILENGTVTIVEFNDFADFEGCGANAELFSWDKDEDVLKGKKQFETRVVMNPLTREALEKTLTKPFKIHLGWLPKSSWVAGVDYY